MRQDPLRTGGIYQLTPAVGTLYLSRNSNAANRYRSFFHTGQVWAPESTCQMWGTLLSSRALWKVLLAFIRVSRAPQDSHSSRSFFLAAASGMRLLGCPKTAEEKPPTWVKVSG